MATEWTVEEGMKVRKSVLRLAATDHEFRALCLTDPSGAVKKATGLDIPHGVNLNFVEYPSKDVSLTLPAFSPTTEIAESDLSSCNGCCGAWSALPPSSILTS